jgi:hypothetical protein
MHEHSHRHERRTKWAVLLTALSMGSHVLAIGLMRDSGKILLDLE